MKTHSSDDVRETYCRYDFDCTEDVHTKALMHRHLSYVLMNYDNEMDHFCINNNIGNGTLLTLLLTVFKHPHGYLHRVKCPHNSMIKFHGNH